MKGPVLALIGFFAAWVAYGAVGYCMIEKPHPVAAPTKLEKTCAYRGAWMPCFIRDEALQQQWSI